MTHGKKSKRPKLEHNKVCTETREASLLFRLPQELRDKIYFEVFSSTRLSSGRSTWSNRRVVTAPNALALLRTCRRIHFEIGHSWLKQVLFSFENPEAMLDMLTNIPKEKRALIRHMRLSAYTLGVSDREVTVQYQLFRSFQLLSGLQLDRLTVLADTRWWLVYRDLEGLIKASSGWKELYYVSYNSMFLCYQMDDFLSDESKRRPQPKHWQKLLENRDGSASRPSVAIYRTKSPAFNGALLDPDNRVPFEQSLLPGETLSDFWERKDPLLCAEGEREKELLVTVKRGKGVDHEQEDVLGDIREDWGFNSWRQIQDMQEAVRKETDDLIGDSEEELQIDSVEVDSYTDVDAYEWRHYIDPMPHEVGG